MPFETMSETAKEDFVVSLATLILHDAGLELSADNINALAKASGNTVKPFWGSLYAKLLAGRSMTDLLMKPGASGPAPAAAGGAAAAPAAGGKAAAKVEEKMVEEEEVGGAGGLFGGDDDW